MCNTLNSKNQRGFSLVELAISMVVIGVLLVPALHGYSLYLQEQKREQTVTSIDSAVNAIGNFRSVYGRYPCPARANAVLGDVDYGMEARTGTTCNEVTNAIWRATSANGALTDTDVFIGALPFRQLNLPHSLIYDGENNQLTYAVTEMLTDDTTFANNNGGITLLDKNGNQLTTTPDSAHFVVLSHNVNAEGAFTREGAVLSACPTPPALEAENCDRDSVFRAGSEQSDFDDLVAYSVTDGVEQWQLSAANAQNIHLKRSDSFAIGANTGDDTSGFATAEIALELADDATVIVEDSASAADLGIVRSDQLCNESGGDCFRPDLIAGQVTDESITCDGNPNGPYLIGIRNGAPVCDDEVTFACPTGQFVTGFDTDGSVMCDVEPPISCPDQNLVTSCGETRNVTSTFSGGRYYGYGYSGSCYRIRSLDTADIDDIVDDYDPTDPGFYDPGGGQEQAMNRIRAELDIYNNEVRTEQPCGSGPTNSQVRDTFACNNGAWDPTPERSIERLSANFTQAPFSGGNVAETPLNQSAAHNYQPASPMAVDANQSSWRHDCWCREDYRLADTSCPGGQAGVELSIERHRCPSTQHNWDRIWGDFTGFCGCQASSGPEVEPCVDYFNPPSNRRNGIINNVTFTRTISCAGTTQTVTDTGHNTAACRCPARADSERRVLCDPVTETSPAFTHNGIDYPPGIEELYLTEWTCPTGTPGSAVVSDASHAGFYQSEALAYTNTCTCNSSATSTIERSCTEEYGAGWEGDGVGFDGVRWEVPINCTTGTFEPPSDAYKTHDDCNRCIWQTGTPRSAGETFSYAAEVEAGSACATCSESPKSCYEVVGTNEFEIWDGCYCAGQ